MNPHQTEKKKHNHLLMMALCCGLPLLALGGASWLGWQSKDFESLLYLVCPVGMLVMMFMMRRGDHQGHSCCNPPEQKKQDDLTGHPGTEFEGLSRKKAQQKALMDKEDQHCCH